MCNFVLFSSGVYYSRSISFMRSLSSTHINLRIFCLFKSLHPHSKQFGFCFAPITTASQHHHNTCSIRFERFKIPNKSICFDSATCFSFFRSCLKFLCLFDGLRIDLIFTRFRKKLRKKGFHETKKNTR